jgi:hypothetical protein
MAPGRGWIAHVELDGPGNPPSTLVEAGAASRRCSARWAASAPMPERAAAAAQRASRRGEMSTGGTHTPRNLVELNGIEPSAS